MIETNVLLTDEFVAFSEGIKAIHDNKKALLSEVEAFMTKAKSDIQELDHKAMELNDKWSAWVAQKQEGKKAKG